MTAWQRGPRNDLTDVAGLSVGNARDERLKSGVTAVLCDVPAVAAVQILGGAPGTRDTDLLAPENTVRAVDALVLAGGSAFGLEAADGVAAFLREEGRGFAIGAARVPIVPAAILFDLLNGGDKGWARYSPYRELGYEAAAAAADRALPLGSEGAGTGATTATFKGGLGSASVRLANGVTVAALVAVNAVGSATVGDTRHFWSAPFEIEGEFGGLRLPATMPPEANLSRIKSDARKGANTTIGIVATDALLDKAECKRLAVAGHDGFAKALWPAHTDLDGDLVFALSTGRSRAPLDLRARIDLAAAASLVMARAIARGIYEARPIEGDLVPAWRERG